MQPKSWELIEAYSQFNPQKKPKYKKILDNFIPQSHKHLNAELKILYTAITRAKRNLWICDNIYDRQGMPSMCMYWKAKQLTRTVTCSAKSPENLVFAASPEMEQWKKQGDYMLRKGLWDQAILCYNKASAQSELNEVYAYIKVEEKNYVDAILYFLEATKILPQRRIIIKIAKCLQAQKFHLEAAELFEKLEKVSIFNELYNFYSNSIIDYSCSTAVL